MPRTTSLTSALRDSLVRRIAAGRASTRTGQVAIAIVALQQWAARRRAIRAGS